MKALKFTMIGLVALLSSFAIAEALVKWTIDEKYSIKFNTEKAEGNFEKFSGDINFDTENPSASKFNVKIEVESISTGNSLKNRHAKGKSWFDAGKYPNIIFASDKISKKGEQYTVSGKLTMHGITKEIEFPFSFIQQNNTGIFKANFSVNRNDFKIGKPGNGVGEKVDLVISVPVKK